MDMWKMIPAGKSVNIDLVFDIQDLMLEGNIINIPAVKGNRANPEELQFLTYRTMPNCTVLSTNWQN